MNQQSVVANERTVFSSLDGKVALALLLAWLAYVAGLLVILPPYWALMDDHGFISAFTHSKVDFFSWVADFMHGGMFRPMYGVFSYFFYKTFSSSSLLAYIFLYFVNVFIFFTWGRAFVASAIQRAKHPESSKENTVWIMLFVVLCFHFIRNNNLFYFASLQERAAIFFLGLAIMLVTRAAKGFGAVPLDRAPVGRLDRRYRAVGAVVIPLLVLFLLTLGFLAKATAIVFLPLFAVWFFLKGWESRESRIACWFSSALFLAAFFLAMNFFSSIRGGYSAGYDFKNALVELSNPQSKFYRLLLLSFATSTLAAWNCFRSMRGFGISKRTLTQLYQVLFWPLGGMAYATIMLPWQGFLNYYLIIPVGMFSVGTKLILFNEITALLNRWKKLPYGLFFIAGIALTSITPMWKFYQKAIHHHGTGKAVEYLKERVEKDGNHLTIRVAENCEETASAVSNFLGKRVSTPMALSNDSFYSTPPQPEEKKILVTHRECREFPESFSPRQEVFRYGEWVIYEQTA